MIRKTADGFRKKIMRQQKIETAACAAAAFSLAAVAVRLWTGRHAGRRENRDCGGADAKRQRKYHKSDLQSHEQSPRNRDAVCVIPIPR
jgi:hypothetical protein